MAVSKDRARPFSRKHRKYWIPVTGGMILIGVTNLLLGFWAYQDVQPIVPGLAAQGSGSAASAPRPVACAPGITARIESELPGSMIVGCTSDHVSLQRGERKIDLVIAGNEIREIAETMSPGEVPAAVMHAFAVTYPRTIPAAAIKRTRRGADPIYELAFPPDAAHTAVTLRADGTVIELR